MEWTYKNCKVTIDKIDTGVSYHIDFGDTGLFMNRNAINENKAKAEAKLLINEFIGDLPPGLSYKQFNNDNH